MGHLAAADRYQRIKYRRCGHSGINLPEVSLGLWQNFGDDRPLDTQRPTIRRAFDVGVSAVSIWRTTTARRSTRLSGQTMGSVFDSLSDNERCMWLRSMKVKVSGKRDKRGTEIAVNLGKFILATVA
jgi:hypothetical protein